MRCVWQHQLQLQQQQQQQQQQQLQLQLQQEQPGSGWLPGNRRSKVATSHRVIVPRSSADRCGEK